MSDDDEYSDGGFNFDKTNDDEDVINQKNVQMSSDQKVSEAIKTDEENEINTTHPDVNATNSTTTNHHLKSNETEGTIENNEGGILEKLSESLKSRAQEKTTITKMTFNFGPRKAKKTMNKKKGFFLKSSASNKNAALSPYPETTVDNTPSSQELEAKNTINVDRKEYNTSNFDNDSRIEVLSTVKRDKDVPMFKSVVEEKIKNIIDIIDQKMAEVKTRVSDNHLLSEKISDNERSLADSISNDDYLNAQTYQELIDQNKAIIDVNTIEVHKLMISCFNIALSDAPDITKTYIEECTKRVPDIKAAKEDFKANLIRYENEQERNKLTKDMEEKNISDEKERLIKSLEEYQEAFRNQNNDYSNKFSQICLPFDDRIKKLEDDNKQKFEEINILKQKIRELENGIKENIASIEKENESKEAALSEIYEDKKLLDESHKKLQSYKLEHEKKLSMLESSLNSIIKDIRTTDEVIESHKKNINKFSNELDEYSKSIENIDVTLDTIAKISQIIENYGKDSIKYYNTLTEYKKKRISCIGEQDKINNEMSVLTTKYDKAKAFIENEYEINKASLEAQKAEYVTSKRYKMASKIAEDIKRNDDELISQQKIIEESNQKISSNQEKIIQFKLQEEELEQIIKETNEKVTSLNSDLYDHCLVYLGELIENSPVTKRFFSPLFDIMKYVKESNLN